MTKKRRKTARKTKRKPGTQLAYDYIKRRILSLDFAPGMSLVEQDIVKQLGVSRTPVREALIKLASEGLVQIKQNRGAWVTDITLSDLREFFEALDVSQRMVTKFAAVRIQPSALETLRKHAQEFDSHAAERNVAGMQEANYRFHAMIAANCGNKIVEEQYLKLLSIGERIAYYSLVYEGNHDAKGSSTGLEEIGEQHRDMLTFLVEGRADKAEDIAREHVETFRKRVMSSITASLAPAINI